MRNKLLLGQIELPSHEKFITAIGSYYANIANNMFVAAWRAYLKDEGSINLVYWSERFDNAKVFNVVLMSLSDAGWLICHSIPARNWAEASLNKDKLLEYCTETELTNIRAHKKFVHYRLVDNTSIKSKATRVNGSTKDTGLTRAGFCAAGNTRFTYDQKYMDQYSGVIRLNLTKSMRKIAERYPNMRKDEASYDTISSDVLDYHLVTDDSFTRGNNYNDSRGRAISSSLSRVANPISCKDFRALLTIPE